MEYFLSGFIESNLKDKNVKTHHLKRDLYDI